MQKKPYSLLNDENRILALKALRNGIRTGQKPSAGQTIPGASTKTKNGIPISDDAARLIAKAISSMLNT